ncbi:Nitroreductase [Chitinophaga sp. YR627]|uniref:NAD(P)H-dependent oxidoreductase n=1 Tax=Chitinophaga sp. YR627 TaxID=1881041 RepID=UPI0008E62353|nr:NAD(P)H-dependent oxidoreductase [Chitinophaga sp. YR627]SFO00047.1 Nitroreductase [Chitinophaga sp. YR627]
MFILDKFHWRYATKKFDPARRIPERQLHLLTEAIRLAPSSYGLQHYRLLVITDETIRQQLASAAWNQPQLLEASHVLLFAAETRIDETFVKDNIDLMATTRGVERETLAGWESMIMDGIRLRSHGEVMLNWAQKQAYIGLGVAVSVAAEMGIDSCPMEGFDVKEFDRILHLGEENLTATVLLPVGYRAADDMYVQLPKVRRPEAQFLIYH